MDALFGLTATALIYIAFFLNVAGYLARDELWLRVPFLAAGFLKIAYYFYVTDVPLWDAILTTLVLALANLWMIVVVVLERTTFSMPSDMAGMYRHFDMLSPGEFRRIYKAGRLRVAGSERVLTTEGARPDGLYFLLDGEARMTKGDETRPLPIGIFVGELAFLTKGQATATVTLAAGTQYFSWQTAALERLLHKRHGLNKALQAQFNRDLVRKVSASVPLRNSVA